MIFEKNDKIVFAGDSITDMSSQQPVGRGTISNNLGIGYVRTFDNLVQAFYPETPVNVYNAGVSGNTSKDLAERFDRDVISINPHWVFIMIGVNDVWRQFDSPADIEYHVLPEEYKNNLDTMVKKAKAVNGIKGVIMLSPYYMEPLKNDPMRARMDEYGKIAKEIADKNSIKFIDIQAMFDNYFKYRQTSFIAWDRVHPNYVGATLIAKEILKHCDFDFNR